MESINHEFIEKYQIILQKAPSSKVFAPLAEAYRKMGMHQEAEKICINGLKHHPKYSSGHLALAKVFLDLDKINEAVNHLKIAVSCSPDNILASTLLAETYVKMKSPKEALKAYKMVLFLNPKHTKAMAFVKKLESLTADEFDEDVFSMQPLEDTDLSPELGVNATGDSVDLDLSSTTANNDIIERHLSLIDAFLARNDFKKAEDSILVCEQKIGLIPELIKRKKILNKYIDFNTETPEAISPKEFADSANKQAVDNTVNKTKDKKIKLLKNLKERLNKY